MIFYYIVVRMPLAYLLSYLGFGLNGIWFAVLVSHVVASVAAFTTNFLNQKHINVSVLVFEIFNLFMLNRMDEFICKFFRCYINNTVIRVLT